MRTSHTFSSLLLLTSALIAPSAIAQTSEQADPAPATTTPPPAEEQPVDVSVPGASFDGEIVVTGRFIPNIRSEEHTSELQSLMRISYAVFCLKKKKTSKRQQNNIDETRNIGAHDIQHNETNNHTHSST